MYVQLVFRSLFISADLFKLDQKVYWGESSLRRYRWDVSWAYQRNWYKSILLPIGNLTVYICMSLPSPSCLIVLTWLWIVGNLAFMSDKSKELTLRVHNECNGSDICTCKPYLIYAIEKCIRGGAGVVVYFRKEGRALGELTKCVPLLL